MKNVLLLLLFIALSLGLQCPPKEQCLCIPGYSDYELQCPPPPMNLEILIHINRTKEILIDCFEDSPTFNWTRLPKLNLTKVDQLRMRSCPLPEKGFKEILDYLAVEKIESLIYNNYNLSNIVLTQDHFKGLSFLKGINLNSCVSTILADDVFEGFENLTLLDLEMNKFTSFNIFQHTPKLEQLDLAQNEIEFIPEKAFENLGKLKLLHLWSNNLKVINKSTFENLTNLKSLELGFNRIETISEQAFKNLKNLNLINLSTNNLTHLDRDIFKENKKLEHVLIQNNLNLILSDYTLANFTHLRQVDLTNCNMKFIPENVFIDSNNISILHLEANQFEELGTLFLGLNNLEKLYLQNNNLQSINNTFQQLKKLKILNLAHNNIREIDDNAFKDLINLEKLSLDHNNISVIANFALQNNKNLKKISLSNNLYSGESSNMVLLEDVPYVEEIDLSHNRIRQIEKVIILYNKVKIKSLNVGYNEITNVAIKDLQTISPKLDVHLEHNQIKTVNFQLTDIISTNNRDAYSSDGRYYTSIYLAHNPLDCDCYNYDLARYFQGDLNPQIKVMFDIKAENLKCSSPPELKNMDIETLPQQLLVCPFAKLEDNKTCPEFCNCYYRPFDYYVIVDCSNKSFTEFPPIEFDMHAEMHLEGNFLRQISRETLTGYENVTSLFLSHNEIQNVEWLPPKLKVLNLDNNQLEGLNYEVLNSLNASNATLTLGNNPWICDCNATNLTNFLRHSKVMDTKQVRCVNSSVLLIDLNYKDLCHQFQVAYVAVLVLILALMAALLCIVYYRYQQPLKVYLYAHNWCLWWVTEEELDKDKIYDAFISYSHKDEEFVVQNLLPVLEHPSHPYKLCLHYRDWIPGEFITTQVTRSVLDSRRTLVVLSPNFLESVWGKMEFKSAHTQAMTDGRARVIIVLYGDVEMDKLDDELKAYLKTNTYVKWGDPYFWNKMKYALPHSKGNGRNNKQKIANVMNCIDDKFNLVGPVVSSSPGTTPPALGELKKHPLQFEARPAELMHTPPAESGTLLVSTCL